MPINPAEVKWDEETPAEAAFAAAPAAPPPIDPNKIEWQQPSRDNSAGRWLGVTTRALAPYATVATAGAAAGAPFAGIGAVPGAAGGVLSLGLSDLLTLGYNAAANAFGGPRVSLPSQTIQNVYERAGIGARPTTPTQQVYSDVLEGTASAVSPAAAFRTLAPRYAGTTQRVLNVMAQQPGAQALSGAFGAGLPSAAANYGEVTDPLALSALGFTGGFLGGKPGVKTDKGPSIDQLRAQADAAYTQAKSAGMVFPNQNFSTLTADIGADLTRQGFNRTMHPKVAATLRDFNAAVKSGNPLGLDDIDVLRRVAKNAAGSISPDERRLGRIIIEKIDDFVMNPQNVSAGNAPEGAFALKKARELWSRKARTEIFDDTVQAAYNRSQTGEKPPSMGQALRQKFGEIANNPKRMKGFSAEEQKYIREIAGGTASNKALRFIADWLTPNSIRGLAAEAGIAASMLSFLGPEAAAVALGTSLAGGASKLRANAMTTRQAAAARNAFATGKAPVPRRNYVMLPAAGQSARATSRGEEAQRLRQQYNLPAWAVRPD
jgi:hypothetical protein